MSLVIIWQGSPKVIMEDLKGDITSENENKTGGLDSREIAKVLLFQNFP